MTLEALIFDVDGTLAETERDGHRVAFNRAFADFGLDWYWSESEYGELLAVTGGKERMLHWWRGRDPQAAAGAGAPALVRALHERKTAHYTAIVAEGGIGLRPGVARLIGQARAAGVRLAIATTTTPANVTALLTGTLGADAPGWFDCIGAGDIVPAKKPAPDIYHWVLRELGMDACACLAFEDSAAGLTAADGAGLRTVITAGEYTRGQEFSAAWAELDGLGEADAPARGRSPLGDWHGLLDLDTLLTWDRADAATAGACARFR